MTKTVIWSSIGENVDINWQNCLVNHAKSCSITVTLNCFQRYLPSRPEVWKHRRTLTDISHGYALKPRFKHSRHRFRRCRQLEYVRNVCITKCNSSSHTTADSLLLRFASLHSTLLCFTSLPGVAAKIRLFLQLRQSWWRGGRAAEKNQDKLLHCSITLPYVKGSGNSLLKK